MRGRRSTVWSFVHAHLAEPLPVFVVDHLDAAGWQPVDPVDRAGDDHRRRAGRILDGELERKTALNDSRRRYDDETTSC
jgi:hypothetical protein